MHATTAKNIVSTFCDILAARLQWTSLSDNHRQAVVLTAYRLRETCYDEAVAADLPRVNRHDGTMLVGQGWETWDHFAFKAKLDEVIDAMTEIADPTSRRVGPTLHFQKDRAAK